MHTCFGSWRAVGNSGRWIWLVALAVGIVAGCQDRAEVTRYTVEKPPPMEPLARGNPHQAGAPMEEAPSGPPTDRTLGAIVARQPEGWFFKFSGPAEAVAAREEEFVNFLKTVSFSFQGKPSWMLPEGWQERPGNQIRYATLVLPGDEPPLEVTVTALPNMGSNDEEYVLLNVNRWRGQLKLPPIGREQLADESTPIDMGGAQAAYVNLAGYAAPQTMGQPPFFSGAADGN